MKIHSLLTMALVPAALVAQTPATPDYMAVLKAETPGIDAQLKDFRTQEAFQKATGLLPAALPTFEKANPSAAMKSSVSFSGLTRLYLLTAKTAIQAGEWEKGLDLFVKADACAKVNYESTKETLTPLITTWTNAVDQAKKFVGENGDRIKALANKARTPEEETEFQAFLAKDKAFAAAKDTKEKAEISKWLQTNLPRFRELEAKGKTPQDVADLDALKVAEGNLVNGPRTIKALQDNIDATKSEADLCAPKIDSAKKALNDEKEETVKGLATTKVKGKLVKETEGPKFEEKRAAYFESVLNTKGNYDSRPGKLEKMNFLFRLRHNAAGTPVESKVNVVIDRVRADQDPLAAEKKGGKAKKAK
jgi:hypothetical protein